MCGICGIVGRADERLLRAMSSTMVHRGPDGGGVRCLPSEDGRVPVGLGHRRLSIIDPSDRAAQPMAYADARYWITYNGELYNFRALRAELEADGLTFRSDCDTEVVVAMYARHGTAMLERMNGMFAFAIWDTEAEELFLARDRLGIKPLYYAQDGDSFVFASEIKAMLPALPAPRLNHELIPDFLTLLWVPDPETLFDGIYKLAAGHYAIYRSGRLEVKQYWDLEFASDGRGEEAWAEELRTAISDAVHRQMVADVPLGSFLSGGIDSSAILAAMTDFAGPTTTYTVGFSRDDLRHEIVPDDVPHARRIASQFGADYVERILSPDIVELLPHVIWHMDEPVADPAAITTYLICREARERLTVMLSGMGGDEVFAGYPRYLAARIGSAADRLPVTFRSGLRRVLDHRLTVGPPGRLRGPRRNLMKLLRGFDLPFVERYLTYSSYYHEGELASLLSPELKSEVRGHDPLGVHRRYFERVAGEHWLNQLLYVDAKTFLPCLNLAYTDKMSMAASTEVRVPFLDDEIVGLAAKIPPELKLRRLTRKYILKQTMKGTLPREVIRRPKAGFGAPVRAWLTGDLRELLHDTLSPSTLAARGLIEPAEVQRLIKANDAGTEDNALRLWALLTLELWQQQFIDRGAVADQARVSV
jgi:asparagine synthase (glutamine-hydrolysing)